MDSFIVSIAESMKYMFCYHLSSIVVWTENLQPLLKCLNAVVVTDTFEAHEKKSAKLKHKTGKDKYGCRGLEELIFLFWMQY